MAHHHDSIKETILDGFDGAQKSIYPLRMGVPLSRLHYFETPLKNPTSPSQNTKAKAESEPSSVQFLPENSLGRIGVITVRRFDDDK
jgi:hypothetical protein